MNYLFCPECHAGLTAQSSVDYFTTHCPCCGIRFSVQKDDQGLCHTEKAREPRFRFLIPILP